MPEVEVEQVAMVERVMVVAETVQVTMERVIVIVVVEEKVKRITIKLGMSAFPVVAHG